MLATAIAETSTITLTLAATIGAFGAGAITGFVMLKVRQASNTDDIADLKRWRLEVDRWRYTEEGRAQAIPRARTEPHDVTP